MRFVAGVGSLFLVAAVVGCGGGGGKSGGSVVGEDPGPIHAFEDYAFQYGMNSSVQNWSSRVLMFADAMMRGAEFGMVENGAVTWNLAPVIPLGQSPALLGEGWPDFSQLAPGERVGSRIMADMHGTMPDGRVEPYVLTWKGTGYCRLHGLPVVGEANRTSNRVEVFIDPTAAAGDALLSMVIDDSSVVNPVRDVHVWMPGMEATKPLFWPPFLDKIELLNHGNGPYAYRMAEWSRVNMYGRTAGNLLFTFDRAGMIYPTSPSQGTRRGMCPEFMVAFCNATQTNLHMQVPHRTADMSEVDYIAFLNETLTRIRDGHPAVPGINGGQPFAGLHPNLSIRLELANEIWNSGFPSYHWMHAQAQAKSITFHQQIASQLEVVFNVADQVFNGPHAHRLDKYVAGFAADPNFLANVLAALPPDFEVNSCGPAAYFGPSPAVVQTWLVGANTTTGDCPNCPTVEEVMAAARDRIVDLGPLIAVHRNLAENYTNPDGSHPALVLYEGGQSLVPGFQPWWPEAHAAQTSPLMYEAYVDYLIPMLHQEGVEIIHWYSFMTDQEPLGGNGVGPFGMWGTMDQEITLPVPEYYVDEGVPKAAAIHRGPPLLNP